MLLQDCRLHHGFYKGKPVKEVSFKICGTIVIIRDSKSRKYGGILGPKAAELIFSLTKNHSIKLSASIKAPERFELLIYGLLSQSHAIGALLSTKDYFLQHPDCFDDSVAYHNPQWLMRPGKELEYVWETHEQALSPPTILRATEKQKVDELLDSATGPTEFKRVQASDFLVTELKEWVFNSTSLYG